MTTLEQKAREYVESTLCSGCLAILRTGAYCKCKGYTINCETFISEATEMTRWRDVNVEPVDNKKYDWVIIKIKEVDTGFEWIPRVGELRNGIWHLIDCEHKLEESFEKIWNVVVTHWRPIETI